MPRGYQMYLDPGYHGRGEPQPEGSAIFTVRVPKDAFGITVTL